MNKQITDHIDPCLSSICVAFFRTTFPVLHLLQCSNHITRGNVQRGVKHACVVTLEGKKPYFVRKIFRLMILMAGVQIHAKFFIWGHYLPCSTLIRNNIKSP